jgi:hypothetical protein
MTSRMTTATERMTYGYGTDYISIRIRNGWHTDTERMAYGYGTDDIRIRNGFHSTDTDTEQIT